MISFLIVIFALSMLYMVTSSRIGAMINMLKLQGIVLCLITFISHPEHQFIGFMFLLLETFVVKAVVIPWFLTKVAKKNNIKRDNNPNFPNFYTLVVTSLVLFSGFMITNFHNGYLQNVSGIFGSETFGDWV